MQAEASERTDSNQARQHQIVETSNNPETGCIPLIMFLDGEICDHQRW